MNDIKILSINPGAREHIPSFTASKKPERIIVPVSDRFQQWFGISSADSFSNSFSRLVVRLVAMVAVCTAALMQMNGSISIFGVSHISYANEWLSSDVSANLPALLFGIAAFVLGLMMGFGIMGRYAALCLSLLTVASLINYAYYNGGVADFSAENQLALFFGFLTDVVAVTGTGRITLHNLLRYKSRYKSRATQY